MAGCPLPGSDVGRGTRRRPRAYRRRSAARRDGGSRPRGAPETHWRARHRVRDWGTLLQQVTHWQEVAEQNWGQHEIEDVGAYLNRQFYGVPCPLPRCSPGTVGKAPRG